MNRNLKAAAATLSLCALFLTGCDNPAEEDTSTDQVEQDQDQNDGVDTDLEDDSRGNDLPDDEEGEDEAEETDD